MPKREAVKQFSLQSNLIYLTGAFPKEVILSLTLAILTEHCYTGVGRRILTNPPHSIYPPFHLFPSVTDTHSSTKMAGLLVLQCHARGPSRLG